MMTTPADTLIDRLWPHGDPPTAPQVFAVIDGARDARIAAMLRASGLEQACLFAGPLTPALRAAAPQLVRLAPRAGLTRELFEHGWHDHWLVLARVAPDVGLEPLRRHFRTLMRVRDEAGRVLMFRFYDPRVLRAYLPTCTPDEANVVFGPVLEFACAGEATGALTTFTRSRAGVHASRWATEPAATAPSPATVEVAPC